MKQDDKIKKRFLAFIVISLLLHFVLLLFFYEIPLYRVEPSKTPPPAQEVVFVNPQDLVPAQSPRGLELADIAKPKVEKVPQKARFASQYNSSVEKETVARKIPKKAQVDVDVSEEPKRSKEKPKKTKPKPERIASAKTYDKKTKTHSDLPSFEDPNPLGKKGIPKSSLSLRDLEVKPSDFEDLVGDYGKGDKRQSADFKESMKGKELASLPSSPGISGPGDRFVHDFMPNVKIGDKTYLNTHAMPNVQYFTRLKRIFRMRFNPGRPLMSHFRSNRVVVGKVNVTMAMEVGANGRLSKIFVVRSSGIPGYDEEALRTVRQSSPFSAPPKAIQDKDGMLRMTWHFTTYL